MSALEKRSQLPLDCACVHTTKKYSARTDHTVCITVIATQFLYFVPAITVA
jgi:hypothetical protein